MTAPEGISMLDKLSAGIVEKKTKAASRGLTPLVGEQTIRPPATITNHPLGMLPDDPDIILSRLRDARREVEAILASIGRLEEMYGKPETILVADAALEQKIIDMAADAAHRDREAAQSADKVVAKMAAERIEAEAPLTTIILSSEARLAKRAALLAAMLPGDAADEQVFEARIAVLADEAQAATFKAPADDTENEDPPEAAPVAVADPVTSWLCSTHGQVIVRTSPRGRKFGACPSPGCAEYERL